MTTAEKVDEMLEDFRLSLDVAVKKPSSIRRSRMMREALQQNVRTLKEIDTRGNLTDELHAIMEVVQDALIRELGKSR